MSSARPTPDPIASKYGFPATIDPAAHHLSHLHGKIVEDQGLRATSPEFGEYEYEAILETLSSYGFVVISEQRPKGADGWEFARRGAKQIAEPSNANVPPGQIAVVGAS